MQSLVHIQGLALGMQANVFVVSYAHVRIPRLEPQILMRNSLFRLLLPLTLNEPFD